MSLLQLKQTLLVSLGTLFLSCTSSVSVLDKSEFKLHFLDEFIIENDTIFPKSIIGGLSGIDYDQKSDKYFIVSDDANDPRVYTASISIENYKFSKVSFDQLIPIKNYKESIPQASLLDLESIRILNTDQLLLSSEGVINKGINPSIFIADTSGTYLRDFELPSYFLTNKDSKNKPRHNAAFEGITLDIDKNGFWVSTELPLLLDGEEPTHHNQGAPIRVTHFDFSSGKADSQFTYTLDRLFKERGENFGINGVTDIIQLTQERFLVLERAYIAGYGTKGNNVRIYLATIEKTTNTLNTDILTKRKLNTAKKTILLNFETVLDQLTRQSIDNIEGMTLGPLLPNGNQSILLIADNNFNPPTLQVNQLILLELIKK